MRQVDRECLREALADTVVLRAPRCRYGRRYLRTCPADGGATKGGCGVARRQRRRRGCTPRRSRTAMQHDGRLARRPQQQKGARSGVREESGLGTGADDLNSTSAVR